jgi:hypothetical protein
MKVFLFLLVLVIGITIYFMGQSKWHLQRNHKNQLPTGKLTLQADHLYLDEAGLKWERQPPIKNKFHQAEGPVEAIASPYPNVIDENLKMDVNNANLKFLCPLENGGSYEAILQPDGSYLTEGKKQGTYNYGHPDGLIGMLKHTLLDVIPHFVNSKYE